MDKINSLPTTNSYEQSYPLLSKENYLNRCSTEKKCPCPSWCNCPYYVDITQQEIRLKLKSPERKSEIEEWYETCFRFIGEFHNLYCSG